MNQKANLQFHDNEMDEVKEEPKNYEYSANQARENAKFSQKSWKPLNRKPFDPNWEIRSGLMDKAKNSKSNWKC